MICELRGEVRRNHCCRHLGEEYFRERDIGTNCCLLKEQKGPMQLLGAEYLSKR
jgi:hypothetical protein